jgi:hypothetical protein
MEPNQHQRHDTELEHALKRVAHIDLHRISNKLHYENPEFWTRDLLERTEEAYRRFLALNLLYPTKILAVNRVLDEYWHCHIIDTRKYAEDCTLVFGGILHHYPYFGMPGEEDEGENVPAFAITEQLWKEAFGSSMVRDTSPRRVSRLSLDKLMTDIKPKADDPDAGPRGCKNGQHCSKVVGDIGQERTQPIAAVLEVEAGLRNP